MAKIYTKTGDKGMTSLLGGMRVSKGDLRIDSYGTVDELNSWIGLIADQDLPGDCVSILREIQDRLFTAGSKLASAPGKSRVVIPDLADADVELLEKEIDRMTAALPELKVFILPGGHPSASYCHIARCVCRRAERIVVTLSRTEAVDELLIRYLNRLSDFLFTMARYLLAHHGVPEVAWKPRLPGNDAGPGG